MYLDDPEAALARLAARLEPDGMLSVTFRNGAALAFRPGMRRRWQAAVDAFDAVTYVNELGVEARAERLDDIAGYLTKRDLTIDAWYGVRVFTDPASGDERVVDGEDFEDLIQAEQLAGKPRPLPATRIADPPDRTASGIGQRRIVIRGDEARRVSPAVASSAGVVQSSRSVTANRQGPPGVADGKEHRKQAGAVGR